MLNQSCQQCGSANAEHARFCARCGAPLDQDQTVVQNRPAQEKVVAPNLETNQRAPHSWLDDKTDAQQEALPQNDQGSAPDVLHALPTQTSASIVQTKQCPFCAETIRTEAIKCRFCSETLDSTRRQASAPAVYQTGHVLTPMYQQQPQVWNPAVAGLLSFFIPGVGQLYKGSVGTGIMWFFAVIIGYAFLIVPGLILHIICICTAASGDTSRRGG